MGQILKIGHEENFVMKDHKKGTGCLHSNANTTTKRQDDEYLQSLVLRMVNM